MKEQEIKKVSRQLKLSRKIVNELINSSTFEKSIQELIDIDIYKGIKSLNTRSGNVKDVFKYTGIEYVADRVRHYLLQTNIARNIFVEYSLVSSTLDPDDPDKLQCCSFIINKDERFKVNIEKYYTSCIDKTEKDLKISIYQHPEFIYNIDTKKKAYNISDSSTLKLRRHKIAIKKTNYVPVYEKERDGYNIHISSFKLDRSFSEMTRTARDYKGFGLQYIHKYLHGCCHENISMPEGRNSQYVSFPIFGSRASNQLEKYKVGEGTPLQGIGACFIYFELNDSFININGYQAFLSTIIQKIVYEIGKVIRFISANYSFNLGLQLQDNARKESIKSAKAAIMSRNMSHNLGSHVMSYLKQHLGSVQSMVQDQILAEFLQNEEDFKKWLVFKGFEVSKDNTPTNKGTEEEGLSVYEKIALPFLVGMGQFISYLQERQDFIATIATDYIPYYSSVNFKDFIYDELNPDKRYERHKDRKNLRPDNILLGNIARSEGLGRPTSPTISRKGNNSEHKDSELYDIVIKFRDFDGNPVTNRKKASESLEQMRDYDVSLPGGVVGRQAIFSILENVIRNAAKHGNWRDEKKLEIAFDIFSKETVNQRASTNDALNENHRSLQQVLNDFYCTARDANELYFVTITDNLSFNEEGLSKLRKALASPYVNEKGEMEGANKGIKEMRISASWLRSINNEFANTIHNFCEKSIEHDSKWQLDYSHIAPVLYARISAERNNLNEVVAQHLQYIFCLSKPKEVAVISSIFKKKAYADYKNYLSENMWGGYTVDEFISSNNKSFEFVILADSDKKRYNEIRMKTSSRLYLESDLPDLKDAFKRLAEMEKIDTVSVKKKLYQYLSDCSNETTIIAISDKTASGKYPNSEACINIGEYGNVKLFDGLPEDFSIFVPQNDKQVTLKKNNDIKLYVYRSHYESENVFNELVNTSAYDNCLFVEGITGNNSTDRLVRNDEIDDLWFYKHLHAMKERIGIFDERIFSKVYGLEESDFLQKEEIIANDIFAGIDDEEEDSVSIYSENAKQIIKNKDEVTAKSYVGTIYEQKGVIVFSLIRNAEDNRIFNLYGIECVKRDEIRNSIKKNGKYLSKCIKYAQLTWENGNLRFIPEKPFKEFDHITIHQGLLDKMYDAFGIKDSPKDKEQLTHDFYEHFSSKSDIITYTNGEYTKYFLPGMCIHSGRSKPSENDMPQHLPFIQYASIENAVLDCKYSLVELLDYARYE